jgi:hypothetical protein
MRGRSGRRSMPPSSGAGFLAGCVATALVVFRARSWRSLRILPLPLGVLSTTLLRRHAHPSRPLPLAPHRRGDGSSCTPSCRARDRVLAPAGGRRRAGALREPAANGAAGLVRRAGVGAGGRGRRAVRRAGRAGRALAVADHPPPRPRRRRLVPALRQRAADRRRVGAPVLRTTPVDARRIRPLEGQQAHCCPVAPAVATQRRSPPGKSPTALGSCSAPDRIRTCDLRFRRTRGATIWLYRAKTNAQGRQKLARNSPIFLFDAAPSPIDTDE